MSLRSLILLNIINQNFHAAADSAVIGVKTETANFQRFSAAFVLSGVDSGIQSLNQLIVAPEKRVVVNRFVAAFDVGRERVVLDRDAFIDGRNNVSNFDLQIFEFFRSTEKMRVCGAMFLPENLTIRFSFGTLIEKFPSASLTAVSFPFEVSISTVTFGTSSNCCVKIVPEKVRVVCAFMI